MKSLFTLVLFLIISSKITFAQESTQAKLPFERLESEFFTDDTNDFSESQRITLINNAGDDSPTLQNHINTLSVTGGGVITIPAGTWDLGEIKLLSNVHLMFDENAIVKPVLSAATNKSIFIIGFNGASISNVSIRSLSGQFTIDMSALDYELRVLPFNIKEVQNFMIAGCYVIDKRTIHSTINCGVSKRNDVWAGSKFGLVKDITVENAHDGYGAVQVRVGERLHFRNIVSLSGGATLRIETDAHSSSGKKAPREVTTISDISAYNIKCNEGNSAVMIQPWGVKNGRFDVQKIEATSCMASVRVDRAFVTIDAENVGSFDPNSTIIDVTSTYGTKAHIKDGSFKSVPCQLRDMISDTPVEGTEGRFYVGPTIAPILYNASSTGQDDPRYYRINIPSESELISQSSNFPENSLIVSRWSNNNTNCTSNTAIIPVTNLTVTPSELNISVGAKENLTQTVNPAKATNQGVSWISGDETIAHVDQWGAVTGIKEGKTTITVNTTDGNKTATIAVNIGDNRSLSVTDSSLLKRQIKIYPNPNFQDNIAIELAKPMSNISVTIYKIQGETIFNKDYSNKMDKILIDTSSLNLSSGAYIITIKSDMDSISNNLIID